MARANQKVADCFRAAVGMTAEETRRIGTLAEQYGSGDIAADYAAAVEDIVAERQQVLQAVEQKLAEAKAEQFYDSADLEKEIKRALGVKSLGANVQVVDSLAQLDIEDAVRGAANPGAVAWTRDGKAVLIAPRIRRGQGMAVFLHEVGAHLGMERLLGPTNYETLVKQVRSWAANHTGLEGDLARKAVARAEKTKSSDGGKVGTQKAKNDEVVAYFVEEAVNAGVRPSVNPRGEFSYAGDVLRAVWAAVKSVLRALIKDASGLDASGVVTLAYGAARLEVAGMWHGSGAVFRKFSLKHLGSGTGNQVFAWGQYLGGTFKVGQHYAQLAVDRAVKNEAARIAKKYDGWVFADELKDSGGNTVSAAGVELGPFTRDNMLMGYLVQALNDGTGLRLKDPTTGKVELVEVDVPDARLYWADVLFDRAEAMQFYRRISDQPENVQAALRPLEEAYNQLVKERGLRNSFKDSYAGGWFTSIRDGRIERLGYLGEMLLTEKIKNIPADVKAALDAGDVQKAEALYLDSKGVPALAYEIDRAAFTRLRELEKDGSPEAVAEIERLPRNYVVFNENNIVRVADFAVKPHTKSVEQSSVRYSESAPNTAALEAEAKWQDELKVKLRGAAADGWVNTNSALQRHLPKWLTDHMLSKEYGDELPSLREYVGVVAAMRKDRTTLAQRAHEVAVEWYRLPEKSRQSVNLLAYASTIQAIDPREEFGKGANSHLTEENRPAYDALRKKYLDLKKVDPQAAKVFDDAAAELKQQWNDRFAAYNEAILSGYRTQIDAAKASGDTAKLAEIEKEQSEYLKEHGRLLARLQRGVYFPLMRFGEFLVVAKSDKFIKLENDIESGSVTDAAEARRRLDEMKKDPKHYVVSAHETQASAKNAEAALKAKGFNTYQRLTTQYLSNVTRTSHHFLSRVIDQATTGLTGDAADQVRKAITDVFMQSLPELHALRREAERKGVEGASQDMLRAFAATSESNAFYTSRLKYGQQLSDALQKVKRESEKSIKLQFIHRELEQRYALNLTFSRTPVQDFLSSAAWVYYLGVSPAALTINMSQPWLVSVPVLSGQFGLAKTFTAMKRASADAFKIVAAARWKDGKFDPWSGIDENTLPNNRFGNADRKMLRELMRRGILDDGAQNDNSALASGSNMTFHKFNRVMGWATQQVEMINRMATALAAFRLAYNGGNYEQAVQSAYDAVMDTQFDYTQEGSARVMRTGGGVPLAKLVFQFRRYQHGILYLLASNFRRSLQGDKAARSALIALTATATLSAGVLGAPAAAVFFAIANAFIDDDDPEGDAETQFRNALYDLTGNKTVADTLAKGIPALFGADLSARIGLGDVLTPFPMARFTGATAKDDVKELMFNAAGPAAGLAAKLWDGMNRFAGGDWVRGTEMLLPKVGTDIIKAARMTAHGITDQQGVPTGTELDAFDIALRAFGITPTAESRYYEGTRALKSVEDATDAAKSEIRKAFYKGLRDGDMSEARKRIVEFNAKHPNGRITPQIEQRWRTEYANKLKESRNAAGVRVRGSNTDVARFATGD